MSNELFNIDDIKTSLPLYKSFDMGIKDGKLTVINKFTTPHQSVLNWCYFALRHKKGTWELYSDNFGSELSDLLGKVMRKDIAESECRRYINDCLLRNEYILNVEYKDFDLVDGQVYVTLIITTIYDKSEVKYVF